jgi:hypothetical protein
VSIIKDIYGKIVTFAARESEDFAASIGFDGRQGSSYETNALAHAYNAAKMAYNSNFTLGASASQARVSGYIKEMLGGDLGTDANIDDITNPDSIKDLYNNEVGIGLVTV